MFYFAGDYSDHEAYAQLARRYFELEFQESRAQSALLSFTPPEVYRDIVEQLGRAGLAVRSPDSGCASSSKNFGRDLSVRKELNRFVLMFSREADYRIDHYLGKDTVQNLLVLRFGNGIFEPLWNGITRSCPRSPRRNSGVERRGGF